MQSILISIQPQWVEKILNGEKTIEIRKTMPKCDLPVKVYIYCTKAKPYLYRIDDDNNVDHESYYATINGYEEEINQLKQQLAESEDKIKKAYREGLLQKQFDKDAEIMLLKQQLTEKEQEIEEINREFVQSTHDWKEIVKEKVQSKTEFAIQQLEKTRKIIDELLDNSRDKQYKVWEVFDQIIKELEGETK